MRGRIAALTLAGIAVGGIVLGARVARPPTDSPRVPYVSTFAGKTGGVARVLASGDGQFFAAIAADPILAHPEVFPSRGEAAYRAQRPLLSYLSWLASLGDPARVDAALLAVVVLACGVATGACAALAARRSANPIIGFAVLLMPGSLAVLAGGGSELLGLGLGALGILAWTSTPARAGFGTLAFTAAGLARETMLVVPIVLAAYALRRRPRDASALVWLGVPLVVWAGWVGVVRLRIGVWPESAGRVDAPMRGFFDALPGWSNAAPNFLVIAVGVAISIALVAFRRGDMLAVVALAYLLIAVLAGADVWHAWENFSRPILPLYAFGLIALASRPTRSPVGSA